VARILRRNGIGRPLRATRMHCVNTNRYNKQVPGHHIQMGVKLLTFIGKHIIEKFPFRIKAIPTDNGHEFQAKFHWYVDDQGIRHAFIKRGTPQLNGTVERSHRSDQQEFYHLLSYKGDVDLEAKLSEWENYYNFNRSHGTFNGKMKWLGLFGQVNRFYKWMTAGFTPQPGLVGAG
jgi:transposase InsO family protein